MKYTTLITSLFILTDAATAGRVGNASTVPSFGNGIGNNGEKIRVFIKFAPGSKTAILNAFGSFGGKVIHSFNKLNTFAASLPTAALDALSRDLRIVFVEQDPIRSVGPIIQSTAAMHFHLRRATHGQTVP
jgi:hypothetical protein